MDDDRRMTDVEALMWNVEKDPFLSSTFGNITVFDTSPDFEYLKHRMLRTVARIPRLGQRVAPALGRLAPPEWQDDPDFDIDYHMRRLALAPPATMRELRELACSLVHDPFDRTRPLWEFYVIEGLEGGRAALVQKMHHTITDGEGGIRMSEQFIDLGREPEDLGDEAEAAQLADRKPSERNVIEAAAETVGHSWRRGLGVAQRALVGLGAAVAKPADLAGQLVELPGQAVGLARSTMRQVTVTDGPHSALWADRSLRRCLEILDVDFDDAKRAGKAMGGSLNDLFVTGAARGAGAYHRRLGEDVETLRMAMPISTRQDSSAGGNSFVPTRELVPTDVDDPAEQFRAVHEVLTATKGEQVIGVVGAVAGIANLFPTSVLVRFTRQQVETVDFTTSNVRAAPFDLFIAGARIEANYPIGPLAGTAFNLTMMSYRGQLNMGLHIDAGAIAEPRMLRDSISDAFAELIAAGSG